jgi:hemolysin activation/secretion protein
MRKCLVICVGSALGVSLALTEARAQVRPGTAQPGQVERQFERPPEPSAKPGSIAIPAPGQQAPANAEGIRFVLTRLVVEGVTVYRPDALEKLYAASINREVTLADVYRIVDVLTARYRNDGYILSQVIVPAQSVEGGEVRLQAIEGYIDDVRVEGGSAVLQARARKYGDHIKGKKPLTAATLERNVLCQVCRLARCSRPGHGRERRNWCCSSPSAGTTLVSAPTAAAAGRRDVNACLAMPTCTTCSAAPRSRKSAK